MKCPILLAVGIFIFSPTFGVEEQVYKGPEKEQAGEETEPLGGYPVTKGEYERISPYSETGKPTPGES